MLQVSKEQMPTLLCAISVALCLAATQSVQTLLSVSQQQSDYISLV